MVDATASQQEPVTARTLTLRFTNLDEATASSLPDRLVTALSGAGFDPGRVEIIEASDLVERTTLVDTQIVPLSALYIALPPDFQTAEVLDALVARYWHEVGCLRRSVGDPRCIQPALRLYEWRRAGTQWICEFMSWDRSVPVRGAYNLHGQETSQWYNPLSGWHGHQGAIVFDERDQQVSAHH